MTSRAPNIRLLFLAALAGMAALLAASPAAEPQPDDEAAVERAGASDQNIDRVRLARRILRHDFENRRNPDTGVPYPDSADANFDGWPDFWEPVRAVGFPEYLINTIGIVADDSGQIPGAYRDEPNHVLHMAYDGTKVGVRTREAVAVEPNLAYEFSIRARSVGLRGARIRAGVDWMRIEPSAATLLRSDWIPDFPAGQIDWPVRPARMQINNPPPTANAAKMFVIIERRPDAVGGAYHGELWFDDVHLRPLPRIIVSPPRSRSDAGSLTIPVTYTGLNDNIPDPANPGYFKGKRYYRRVEVTDVFNQPMNTDLRGRRTVESDAAGRAVEDIVFPRGALGVYYFNIRLYDADDRLTTDVMRAVAIMRPAKAAGGPLFSSRRPAFGVRAGSPPEDILSRPGLLKNILALSGVRQTKLVPWVDPLAAPGGNNARYAKLADEIRGLRALGIGVTGVVGLPPGAAGDANLAESLEGDADRLKAAIGEAGRTLGLYMDSWQWGDDPDASLNGLPETRTMADLAKTLGEFSGNLPIAWNLRLGFGATRQFPLPPRLIDAYLPASRQAGGLWPDAAPLFPWLFDAFFNERGATYPPERLARLARPPAVDPLEQQERARGQTGVWLSLESPPAHPNEPNQSSENIQLEQTMIRSVYAAALGPDIVFAGELFDPARGLLRADSAGDENVETMARPAFLALATLSEHLEGAEYLGELSLMQPFEAHVFRRPGGDQALIVLWHNGPDEVRRLDRAEIANGPRLQMADWAGNVLALPASIPVRRIPAFITGLPASIALTRMSVRIAPDPPMLAATRRQNQLIEIVNHTPRQMPVVMRLRYAARADDGAMENGWTVSPEELRLNLSPVAPQSAPGRMRYAASPDPNSPIQRASPDGADKSGMKIAQVRMFLNSSPPADMTLYLKYRLRSELDIDIERLDRPDDPHFATVQLKVRWFPEGGGGRRRAVKLTPFYQKRGQMKEPAAFPITVKPSPPEDRGRPDAPFESVELRVPLNPRQQTWVGLDEDVGSMFYLADITDLLGLP